MAESSSADSRRVLLQQMVGEFFKQKEAQTEKRMQELSDRCQTALEDFCAKELVAGNEMKQQLVGLTRAYEDLRHQNAALRTDIESVIRHIHLQQWMPPMMASPWAGFPMPTMPMPHPPPTSDDHPGGYPPAHYLHAQQQTPQAGRAQSSGTSASSSASSHGASASSHQGHSHSSAAGAASASSAAAGAPLPTLEEGVEENSEDELSPVHARRPGSPAKVQTPDISSQTVSDQLSSPRAIPATPPRGVSTRKTATPVSATKREGQTPSTAASPSPSSPLISLTLRRVDPGEPLGLEVSPDKDNNCLLVEGVRPGTVVDAWNRQCQSEPRTIMRGDRVVSVNGATDPEEMRKECSQRLLLKLEVARDVD